MKIILKVAVYLEPALGILLFFPFCLYPSNSQVDSCLNEGLPSSHCNGNWQKRKNNGRKKKERKKRHFFW